MHAEIILSLIVVAQLGLIWGLVNRLVKQAGLKSISAIDTLKEAERLILQQKPTEAPREHLQRFGRKIGSTGPIDPLPNYSAQVKK